MLGTKSFRRKLEEILLCLLGETSELLSNQRLLTLMVEKQMAIQDDLLGKVTALKSSVDADSGTLDTISGKVDALLANQGGQPVDLQPLATAIDDLSTSLQTNSSKINGVASKLP